MTPITAKPGIPIEDLFQNALLASEGEKMSAAFRRRRIPFYVLKGFPLLKAVTPGFLKFKTVGDIDVLIQPKNIPACMDILFSLGYHHIFYPEKSHEEMTFRHHQIGTVIELHTTAFSFPRQRRVDQLFFPMSGKELTTIDRYLLLHQPPPNDPIVFIVLLVHLAVSHGFRGAGRLKTTAALLNTYTAADRLALIKTIRRLHLLVYFLVLCKLLSVLYGLECADLTGPLSVNRVYAFYASLYFFLYPVPVAAIPLDVDNLRSPRATKRFLKTVRIIKILCAEQPVEQKILGCLRLLVPTL